MTTYELLQYYISLLIFQYLGLPKAEGTISSTVSGMLIPQVSTQQISFSITPTSGTFTLTYGTETTAPISYTATDAQIQSALEALSGLSSVTVLDRLVTLTGVIPPALPLIATSSLTASGVPVTITITETDLTLPLAVQNAYNLTGPNIATGVQLDILGKYAGVSRNGIGITGPVTLSDANFYILIQFATLFNSAGSSLGTIAGLFYPIFGRNVLIFDYLNMRMSYLINSSIGGGNGDLIQVMLNEGLIPKPMGVQLSIVYAPIITEFFGFRMYGAPSTLNNPFNTYQDYHLTWPWLTYNYGPQTFNPIVTEGSDFITQENGGLIYTDP